MSAILEALTVGFIRGITLEFVAWLVRKGRPAGWVPQPSDVEEFLAEIAADTPAALKAKVAAELGVPWPPKPDNN